MFFEFGGGFFEGGGFDVAEGELADAVAGEGVGCVLTDTFKLVSYRLSCYGCWRT